MQSSSGSSTAPPPGAGGRGLAPAGPEAGEPARAPHAPHGPGSLEVRAVAAATAARPARPPLYTPEQRARRDATRWTLVQGVLAPLQFVVMLVSVALVLRYLATGNGLGWATGSVLVKTLVLYTIMVTGCAWEKVVFGRWLFAPAFFWEDVVSLAVIALHTAYLVAWWAGVPGPRGQMAIALVAYAVYTLNAVQFLAKLRAARRDEALRRGAGAERPRAPHRTAAPIGGAA